LALRRFFVFVSGGRVGLLPSRQKGLEIVGCLLGLQGLRLGVGELLCQALDLLAELAEASVQLVKSFCCSKVMSLLLLTT
jgi:hypothetical protein